MIDLIVDFVEKNSWFEFEEVSEDIVYFRTREHGNVGDETTGSEDIIKANELAVDIRRKFEPVEVEIEEVDEWVHINVTVK